MELNEYQQMVTTSYRNYPHELGPFYTVLGIDVATGKLSHKLMNILTSNGKISDEDKQEICSHLSDILFYVASTANDLALSFEDVAQMNIDRLNALRKNALENQRNAQKRQQFFQKMQHNS